MSNLELHDMWNRAGGPKYPHEKIVQFCFRNYPPHVRGNTRVLDLGCGSGVHCEFLAREGFLVTGIDAAPAGVENTRARLAAVSLNAQVEQMALENLSFSSLCFDLVLCVGVLQCVDFKIAQEAMKRIVDYLKKDCRGIFIFSSDEDTLHQKSPLGLRGYSRYEIAKLFCNFNECYFDRYITTYFGGQFVQNEWIVTFHGLKN